MMWRMRGLNRSVAIINAKFSAYVYKYIYIITSILK